MSLHSDPLYGADIVPILHLLAQQPKTRGRIAKIQSDICWERFWRVWKDFFTSSHSGDLSMRITGNVLGLQGQPKVASPQTSVYPPSVWLKCYLLECMACQVDRWFTKGEEKSPVAAETRGPCDFKDTGDFLSSKHLCVIEALLSRMCRIWQLASCNSHRTSWLASRLDFLQSAGCIHVYSDPVMCILIQYVRKYSLEKWRNESVSTAWFSETSSWTVKEGFVCVTHAISTIILLYFGDWDMLSGDGREGVPNLSHA